MAAPGSVGASPASGPAPRGPQPAERIGTGRRPASYTPFSVSWEALECKIGTSVSGGLGVSDAVLRCTTLIFGRKTSVDRTQGQGFVTLTFVRGIGQLDRLFTSIGILDGVSYEYSSLFTRLFLFTYLNREVVTVDNNDDVPVHNVLPLHLPGLDRIPSFPPTDLRILHRQ